MADENRDGVAVMVADASVRVGRRMFLVAVVVYAVIFTALNVPWLDLSAAGPVDLIYGFAFGIVAAAIASLALRALRSFLTTRQRLRLILLPLSVGLTLGLCVLRWYLPDSGWRQMPAAPAPLIELVSTSHVGYFGGNLYARSADGRLQVLQCLEPYDCTWEVVGSLPDHAQSCDEYRCPGPGSRQSLLVLPPAPRNPVQLLHLRELLPDAGSDWYYTLTKDGVLWSLGNSTSGFDCLTLPFAALAGIAGARILEHVLRSRLGPVEVKSGISSEASTDH